MPNKIHSAKQYRFFRAAASGKAKTKGLGSAKAQEILDSESHKKKSMFSKRK